MMQKIWFRFCKSPKAYIYLILLIIAAIIILSGNSLSKIYPFITAISAFSCTFGILYLISARVMFSLSTSSLIVIILQILNQLKVHFYKDKLVFPDILMMSDPSNFGTLLHYPLAGLAILGLVVILITTVIIGWRVTPRKSGFTPVLISLSMIILSGILLNQCITRYQSHWTETLPGGTGIVSNLVMSSMQANYHSPSFPEKSSHLFIARAAALHKTIRATSDIHPDIVLLLQESTTDPRLYQVPEPAKDRLPHFSMFEKGPDVKAHTLLRVQTFGGGTWLSEFAALTGLRSDDFGAMKNAVFYSAIDNVNDSLFKQMKANGYYTVVLTPFNKSAYHAGHAYTKMGVDRIIQPQELGYPGSLQENLWHITTGDMLGYVKKILAKETDKPLFIYALTMYEHGPYSADHQDDYQLAPLINNPESAGKFSHYVEKIKNSDTALNDFFQFMDKRQKPTIFMYFGDHQPAISWSNGYTSPLPDAAHLTQFSLRDNFNLPPVQDLGPLTDIAFLGGMLLEQANLKVSPYYQANIDMRHLCNGALNDCKDKALFDSYRHYIYDDLHAASKPKS